MLKQVGINPVVVHGGGPQINAMLKRLAIQSTFIDGLRVTDAAMVEVVEMVLAGTVNKYVASLITRAGALAVGICGKDGGMIRARKLTRTERDPDSNIERVLDLGFVGEPVAIDVRVIHALTGGGLVPVIAPVGVGDDGQTYNINADTVAAAVAGALQRDAAADADRRAGRAGQGQAADPGPDDRRGAGRRSPTARSPAA